MLRNPPESLLLNNGVVMPAVGFGSAALGDGTQVWTCERVLLFIRVCVWGG